MPVGAQFRGIIAPLKFDPAPNGSGYTFPGKNGYFCPKSTRGNC